MRIQKIGATILALTAALTAALGGVSSDVRGAIQDGLKSLESATSTGATSAKKTSSAAKSLQPLPFDAPPPGFDVRRDGVRYGDVREVRYFSKTTETERTIFVLLPPGYDDPENAAKTYPVLFLLHGIGGNEREWFGGAPVEILGNLVADGKAREAIVVLPNGRARHKSVEKAPGLFSPEHFREFDAFLVEMRDDLNPFIKKTYRCKPGRENRAVAGLSMGGRSALHIGLTLSDEFGAIGAFEPAPGVLASRKGATDGLFAPEELTVPSPFKGATAITIVKGSRDDVVGDQPRKYAEKLVENGDSPEYYVLDGGHDFKVWKESFWLFAQKIF